MACFLKCSLEKSLFSLPLDKPGRGCVWTVPDEQLHPSTFSSVHLKMDRDVRLEVLRTTTRLFFPTTWLLLDCTCSISKFLLHCRQSPYSTGGCYGNAAGNCCDMTHDKCEKSHGCDRVSQRGFFFSSLSFFFFFVFFPRKPKPTSASKLTRVCSVLVLLGCLFHAQCSRVSLRRPKMH